MTTIKITQDQFLALQARKNRNARSELVNRLTADDTQLIELEDAGNISVKGQSGDSTKIRFGPNDLVCEVQCPSGATERYTYDRNSRLETMTHSSGDVWRYGYDANGLVNLFEVMGHAQYAFEYDENGYLAAVHYPDELVERFDRDIDGEIIRHTHRSGVKSEIHKIENGQVFIDPLGFKTTYRTDGRGALDSVEFPDGTQEFYEFSEDSNAVYIKQRSHKFIVASFSEDEGTSDIQWDDGERLTLRQNNDGTLLEAKSRFDEVEFVYGANNELIKQISTNGTVQYQYDPRGKCSAVSDQYGQQVAYNYDPDGRLAQIIDWDGRVIKFEPSSGGNDCRIQYPNGTVEASHVTRRPLGLDTTLTNQAGNVISRSLVQFGKCDRISVLFDAWGSEKNHTRHCSLEYDDEFRISALIDKLAEKPLASFGYDANGNQILDGAIDVKFGPMGNPIMRGSASIEYDLLGNVTGFQSVLGCIRLEFSDDSRLKTAHVDGRKIEFQYDGLCRRIQKTVGNTRWNYGWSGFQMLWEEYRSHPGADPVRRDYLYRPGVSAPIAFREGGHTYWTQSDVRGAIVAVHDLDGKIVWRAIYDSFGNADVVVNEIRQPWRLAGQYLDEETGLHYNVVRYFSPELKSYLSIDPRWQEPEGSTYSYCRNDPWNRADPTGALAPLIIGAIAVGGAGLISGCVAAYNAPKGEGMSAFGKGFAVGAGAALTGIGAAVALTSLGLAATAVAGLAAIGAVEGAVASALDDLMNDRPICWSCMAASAGLGAILGVVIPGVGGFLGRKAAKHLAPKLGPIFRKVAKPVRTWARNRKIRISYNSNKKELGATLKRMRAEGKSTEELKKVAFEFRKRERLRARDEMRQNGDGKLVDRLEARDLKKYGNKDGPNLEHLTEKTKSELTEKLGRNPTTEEIDEYIIESATRTDLMTNLKFLSF